MCTQLNRHFCVWAYRVIGNHQYEIRKINILEHFTKINSHQYFILYVIIVNAMSCTIYGAFFVLSEECSPFLCQFSQLGHDNSHKKHLDRMSSLLLVPVYWNKIPRQYDFHSPHPAVFDIRSISQNDPGKVFRSKSTPHQVVKTNTSQMPQMTSMYGESVHVYGTELLDGWIAGIS